MDWFLYDIGLQRERVKGRSLKVKEETFHFLIPELLILEKLNSYAVEHVKHLLIYFKYMLSLIFVLKIVIKQLNPFLPRSRTRRTVQKSFFVAVLKPGNKILSIASTMEV